MKNNHSFFQLVYQQVKKIPCGKVATYGQIAMLCNKPNGARVVGWALNQTPCGSSVPCHRVVNREGRMAPNFALSGPEVQRELLRAEGVLFLENGNVNLEECLWVATVHQR